jgi:2-C-methyl-D-erythritol 4-phosphate cytidylyltransferase
MQKFAVIVAGGSGTRMGSSVPKQFLDLRGRPVVIHTVQAFLDEFPDIAIILVLPEAYLSEGEQLLQNYFPEVPIRIVAGGVTRFQSVRNGLALVTDPSVVFVHDAVRCLSTPALIRVCYEQAREKGSAIPVIPVRDSLRRRRTSGSEVVDREGVVQVQTPQTFRSDLLLPAMGQDYRPDFTDEATVVEAFGAEVHLIAGEETNIKLTHPADLVMAEMIWDRRQA